MGSWSKASMQDVAAKRLGDMLEQVSAYISPEVIPEACIAVHSTVAAKGASPRDLIAFLAAYKGIYQV